jgi:DNA modification methylase
LNYIHSLDIDFDLGITGFATAEVDLLLGAVDGNGEGDDSDEIPAADDSKPTITKPGDLWVLGHHRLLCGDALLADSFQRLLAGERAQMVFADPPYNVAIDGNVCGTGLIKHREFAMASGEMSEAEFTGFLKTIFQNLVAYSDDGSIHYICMDWRHAFEVLSASRATYTEFKNLCVWNKDGGGLGSLYRSKHELVFVLKSGTASHINNIELGSHGRNRFNVSDYAGVNSLREGRLDGLAMHPTVKPVAMVADAMLDCSKRNGLVLDGFGGSGTTIVAAEKTGRRACVIELDPAYVDVAIRRFEKLSGHEAVHAVTGKTLAETEVASASAPPSTAMTTAGVPDAE